MIVEIMLGIFVVICLVQGYALWNLMIKQEQLEDWTEGYIQKIGQVNQNIDRIDYKGYFEADDEVGQIFEQIKEEVNSLEELTDEGVLNAKKS
jgi:hypothetical protein|tara:strand:+ start:292 stop:570 length:279 start_codon:yes stop_codon:yes gene_type:complete